MRRPHPIPKGTALVTGASSGIGYGYARRLAAMGYPLLLVSNEPERIEQTARALAEEFGVEASALCRDLCAPDAARELFDYCRKQRIEVEILVNNAGVFFFDDLTEAGAGRIARMTDLHVRTVTLLCHYFGARMKSRRHGYILNMASMSAWLPYPGISVYAASKSYLEKLSKALHNELRDHGVFVTAVCPGAVATDLYNLSSRYQRLALRLGIMMTPDRLAAKGLRAMFRRRKRVVPGAINHVFLPLAAHIPSPFVRWIKRHAKFYRYGR